MAVDLRNWVNHVGDFATAIRAKSQPISNIEVTNRSILTAHLVGLVYQTGKDIEWDPVAEKIKGDHPALDMLSRTYREPWNQLVPLVEPA